MRFVTIVLVGCLILALVTGCSEKQKEAEKLEQEMRQMGNDTGVVAGETTAGTAAESSPIADASAIPEEEAPDISGMPPAPLGDGYTVQVAACEEAEFSRHLVDLYKTRGYQPFVQTTVQGGVTYYRVRIGNFDTKAEADGLKRELADRFSLDPWVTSLGE